MKILMLTWEYPPRVVGGIARVVYDLSKTLLKDGHDVTVVTLREGIEMKFVNLEELDKYNISCYHKQIIVKAKDYCLKKMESLDDG